MRNSRQITVLRSLFRTLHPLLESGLAPARRFLTGTQTPVAEEPQAGSDIPRPATAAADASPTGEPSTSAIAAKEPVAQAPRPANRGGLTPRPFSSMSALERTLTDEHLVTELENITRESPREPQRGRRHYSRDTLLTLLEEAKVRIQVLETELELARSTDEIIPLLTEEWSDDLPSTHARKPD